METVIIDAYNLIHKVSELKHLLKQSQDVCVDTMIAKFQNHFFNTKMKVIIAFDGFGKNKTAGNIEVKFSKTETGMDHGSADKLIKTLIEKSKNPKLVKIVSSDNEIIWYARECGARFQTSESFWGEIKDKRIYEQQRIAESTEKPDIVTKSDFDFLMKQFTKK